MTVNDHSISSSSMCTIPLSCAPTLYKAKQAYDISNFQKSDKSF